jgi:hypothetical protein
VPPPPYSSDLAPADFFLFPKLKTTLKGRFEWIEEIEENSLTELRAIQKKKFQDCFQNWKNAGSVLLIVGGGGAGAEYFEGDKAD